MYWSRTGRHAWAIEEANEAVELRRPVAESRPAAMARALAVRALCLHVRGRTAEAARDVVECLAYRDRASGGAGIADLAAVASLLDLADRADEALTLAEQLLAEARAYPRPWHSEPMLVYGSLLLRNDRPQEAIEVLREVHTAAAGWSKPYLRSSAMLFEAFAAAGRLRELEEHARRDRWVLAGNTWGNPAGRVLYIKVLELLERHQIVADFRRPLAVTIAKHRRKLLRYSRRWWVLAVAFALVTGRFRQIPAWPRATAPLDAGRAEVVARVARAEVEVERHRESGDARALSQAWGALAQARWQAGGQRSAALEAQRAALAEARRWAAEDPDGARPALVMHLRRLADFAGTIGLQTDARQARAEAEDLDRADR